MGLKKQLALLALASLGFPGLLPSSHSVSAAPTTANSSGDAILGKAFREQTSNIQVEGRGEVTKILRDDHEGSRHQRFLIRLNSGQSLLIAHNIDLAPRVPSIKERDVISFYGEYEWNAKGGVIHWTHRDPAGRHRAGWLKHKGRTYQ